MGVSGTFCLFAVSFEKREGEYRSISLLKARRTAKKDLIRKSASSSTSYFPLTCAYADGYPVQLRDSSGTVAGSYRGQFNFNLDRNRELPLRFDGILSCGSLPATFRGSRTYARSNFRKLPRLRLLRIGSATLVESKSAVLLHRIARGCDRTI